jgi:hypothetical protein
MKINLQELRAVMDTLLTHLERQDIEGIEIPVDYYWNIPKDQKYDVYNEPGKLDVGQLSDDWSELLRLIGPDGSSLNYHFVWLAAILRSIGDFIPE